MLNCGIFVGLLGVVFVFGFLVNDQVGNEGWNLDFFKQGFFLIYVYLRKFGRVECQRDGESRLLGDQRKIS